MELWNTRSQVRRTWLGASEDGTPVTVHTETILNHGLNPVHKSLATSDCNRFEKNGEFESGWVSCLGAC